MGTNNKNQQDHRTFNNNSPNNKQKYTTGFQKPSPSKCINIKTPNKNFNNGAAGSNRSNNFNSSNNSRLSLSASPTSSFFAASKCFESPSPDSLPIPPSKWMGSDVEKSTIMGSTAPKKQTFKARRALVMTSSPAGIFNNSCAMEYAAALTSDDTNDHFTQNLKLLLNVNA